MYYSLKLLVSIIILNLIFCCANPEIRRHFYKISPNSSRNQKKDADLLSKKSFNLYHDNNIKIDIKIVDLKQMNELSDDLDLPSEQRNYRLPGLTFFKFQVKYLGTKNIKLNFFNTYFLDEFGNKYKPISLEKYKERYTSAVYSKFDYSFMYSFYITKKKNKASEKKQYLSRVPPGEEILLQNQWEGFQIIPYSYFSVGSRRYVLQLPIPQIKTLKIPFYYRSLRADY